MNGLVRKQVMYTHMDLAHKGHVDFGQWLGPVHARRACPILPCPGTIKTQKKATWKPLSTMMPLVVGGIGAGITTIGTFHIRIPYLVGALTDQILPFYGQ
jgi:hypothetical protein